jgi:hypothetical protein
VVEDIDRGKLLIRLELFGNSTSSHTVAKEEDHGKENAEFCLQRIPFIPVWFLTCHKILGHGTAGFTSLPKKYYEFLSPLKIPSSLAGSEPANLVSNGKNINH